MALVSEDKNKISRIPLTQLDTGEVIVRANEALVLHELRNVLRRQAERDLVIEDMRSIIDTLAEGQVAAIEHIQRLEKDYSVLRRQQAELYERQEILANVCDVYAKKLEEQTAQHEKLVEEISDKD